jgi:hypothetical protein
MDQDKTDIPRLQNVNVREYGKSMKVRSVISFTFIILISICRLIGGLLYLKKTHPFGFFFPGERFHADTNSNLECLRRILESIGMQRLPKRLYIQLDNTCKDNKNYKFLSYIAFLLFAGFVHFRVSHFILIV